MNSQGTTITLDGSPIGEVISIDPPGKERTILDMTPLEAEADEVEPSSLQRTTEGTLVVNYDPTLASHVALQDAQQERTLCAFVITFADEDETPWPFNAYVTKVKPATIEVDGKVTCEFGFKPSGECPWPGE